MKLTNRSKTVLSISIFGSIMIVTLLIRLSNPLLTETQLLINFWWVWLIEIMLGIAAIFIDR